MRRVRTEDGFGKIIEILRSITKEPLGDILEDQRERVSK